MSDLPNNHALNSTEPQESPLWSIALLGGLGLLTLFGFLFNRNPANFTIWLTMLSVISTLGIYTILYKENPIFRIIEHIYIGLAVGYGLALTWAIYIFPRWYVPLMPHQLVHGGGGKWWLFIPFLLGLMFFTVYFPKISWMNRLAISVLMGWIAGNAFQAFMGLLAPQITAAFRPPITFYTPDKAMTGGIHLFGHVWIFPMALFALLVLACTLAYFYFSFEQRRPWIKIPAHAGRVFLMITLGAIFGTTVMGRFALLIERLSSLKTSFIDIGVFSQHHINLWTLHFSQWVHHLTR